MLANIQHVPFLECYAYKIVRIYRALNIQHGTKQQNYCRLRFQSHLKRLKKLIQQNNFSSSHLMVARELKYPKLNRYRSNYSLSDAY